MFSSGLPKKFWGEAVMTAAYLVNRSPSTAIEFLTPEQKWSNKIPDLSNLRVFGCTAYAHQSEGKLQPRSIKGVFLGYPQGVKGYRIWLKDEQGFKTINSRDVIFRKDEFPCLKSTNKTIDDADTFSTNRAGISS